MSTPIGQNAYLGSLLSGVWGIAVLLPNLAVGVRRLRDAGLVVLIVLWAQPAEAEVPATTAAPEQRPRTRFRCRSR